MVEMVKKEMFEVRCPLPGTPIELREMVLMLCDATLKRGLTIAVGLAEAYSINLGLREAVSLRPLAHDLILNIMKRLGTEIVSVEIYDLKSAQFSFQGGEITTEMFLTRMNLLQEGKQITIEARPSDAVALAIRAKAPIFVAEELLEEALGEDFEESSQNRQLLLQLDGEALKKFKV